MRCIYLEISRDCYRKTRTISSDERRNGDGDRREHIIVRERGAKRRDRFTCTLAAEHDTIKDDAERLYWVTAAFSTRSPRIIPLLVRYARQAGDEAMRRGATAQLVDMVGEAEAKKLIDAK